MERYLFRLVVGIALVAVGLGYGFLRKNHSDSDYRKAAHALIAKCEGYKDKPDYYDWLVDEGHEHCFSDAYHVERTGRRSSKVWIDDDQYLDDLFKWMINQATEDRATLVVNALTKYQASLVEAPPGTAPKRR